MGVGPSLPQEDYDDLLKLTYFDRRELTAWYKAFIKENPSGIITRAAFLTMYQQLFPFGQSEDFAGYVFRAFDANQDGVIDFKEYMMALSVSSRGSVDEKLDWAFHVYDLDSSGSISRKEVHIVTSSLYQMVGDMVVMPPDQDTPEKRVDMIMAKIDVNHDDSISKEEFVNACKGDPSTVQAICLYDGLV